MVFPLKFLKIGFWDEIGGLFARGGARNRTTPAPGAGLLAASCWRAAACDHQGGWQRRMRPNN